MSTVTELVLETAAFAFREPRSAYTFFIDDAAELGERVSFFPTSTATETAVLNDALTDYTNVVLRDSAGLNDIVTRSVRHIRDLREVADFNDRSLGGVRVSELVTETAVGNDNAAGSVSYLLRASAIIREDTVVASILSTRTLREVAEFVDRASPMAGLTARETAELDDLVTQLTKSRLDVRDTAVLNDTALDAVAQRNVLREAANVSDQATISLQRSMTTREVFYVSDAVTPPPYGRAYTCSVMTWGMTTFSNYPFQTMAGNYAAGNNLWRLDAPTDAGSKIAAYIKTGILDMGAERNKRLSAVYVSGSADDAISVSITGDVNGVKETYDYAVEPRDVDDYRNNRALVGKGFRSRFIQVKIGATGIKYRLLSASADTAMTARRV